VTNKGHAKRTEGSITIPLLKEKKIEIRFQKEQKVYSEKIKKGDAKVFFSNDGCLIVHHNDNGTVRAVFVDKTGKIKDLKEI